MYGIPVMMSGIMHNASVGHYDVCCFVARRNAMFYYSKCHDAVCHYVIVLCVIMLCVVLLMSLCLTLC
jgi:hypothetical protein